ncbi:hypothetical protein SUGI_0869970 [Cryptomeria japonica]|nr:hypothetical protein SUGI_0869970 [Cryptomeria japonica]
MEAMFSCGRVAFAIITILCCFTSPAIACPLSERNLLLDFKAAVVDEYNTLTSWHGFNCCSWRGVSCNLRTGHVSRLDLSGYNLEGNISSSLFQLARLENLDLSGNLFKVNISVNKEWGEDVGSLSNLQQLSMSDCGLGGPIRNSLLNLTSLLHLDLSENYLSAHIPAWFENVTGRLVSLDLSGNYNLGGDLSFIGQRKSSLSLTSIDFSGTGMKGRIPSAIWNISCLEHLRLSDTRIEGEIPASIGNLLSLQSLDLSATRIEGEIPSAIGNALSLESISLSDTRIEGKIPSAIGNVSSLKSLYLYNTYIEGEIPLSIANLSKLVELDLSYNKLTGVIPPSLDSLSSLVSLDLYANKLNGTIPSTISNLVNLRSLSLGSNMLSGLISLSVFDNLTSLDSLYLSYNQLTVNIDSTWIPQFKLSSLGLGSCNLDRIPSFLVTQYDLTGLDLSANSIQTNIPSWIWNLPSLYSLNLSCNQLTGSLPSRLTLPMYFDSLDLHNNSLEGSLHLPLAGAYLLDLSMNQFNGSIPSHIGAYLENARFLSLSRNNLSGAIPDSICTPYLQVLDLSKNTLSSVIPPHLTRNCSSLSVLDLAENHLEGKLPAEWGNITKIHTLKLNGNHLRGVIPSSISEGRSLQVLDLGNNDLEGTLPHWIGKISQLHVLVLRSNHFHGSIPRLVIGLPNLQILDLSGNHLSGAIPSNLTNLLAMVNASQNNSNHLEEYSSTGATYTNQIRISWKGWDVEFVKVLFILKFVVDDNSTLGYWHGFNCCTWSGVSCNVHTGHVSQVDLSGYNLKGNISSSIFQLEQLEHLDLSYNLFNGNFSLPHYGKLKSFTFLDLSSAGYVDEFSVSEFFVNLESLSNLVSLEYLSLDGVSISASKEWGEADRGLSNLQQLSMSTCGLEGPIPNSLLNLTSLLHLNLADNYVSPQIPAWFVNVTAHLLSLNLSMNIDLGGDLSFIRQQKSWSLPSIDLLQTAVEGKIPSDIGNMSSLESLALSYTNIQGEIPHSITNLSKLAYLDLFHSKLTGIIPPSLGSLSSLYYVDLGYNLLNTSFPSTVSDLVNLRTLYLDSINLGGSISLFLFDKLTRLELLDLSYNHLTVNADSAWIPRFEKLNFLGLGSCSLDRIPSFLVSQYDLEHLELPLNNIRTIPSWIWKLPSLTYLNLSCNQLTGSLPSRLISRADLYLDLNNNSLEGALPVPVAGVKMMDLTMNQFSGSIPTNIGEHLQHTEFLSLSKNNLSGAIPDSICTSDLQFLDLSNNMLSSMIPPHLNRNCSLLRVLDLARPGR